MPAPHDPIPEGDTAETIAPPAGAAVPGGLTFGAPVERGEVGTLGPYRIAKLLGKGGMGAVYLATDPRLSRKLALKVMLPQFAADAESRERFVREARAAAQITHDNVVTVYEADERNGVPYIAMQFLQGCPLNTFLRDKGPPPLVHAVRVARETALGLAAAHDLGLVHRDIKPANLWLEAPNGRVKVLDFGLAKPLAGDRDLSGSGVAVGTPAYMSPEQARGGPVDGRTDLFGLGVVLYQMLTGELPFTGPTAAAVLVALGADTPRPVRDLNPDAPASLAALTHQLLSKRPDDRPPTAAEVARRLRAIRDELLAGPAHDVSTSRPVAVAYPVRAADAPMVISAQHESAFAGLDADDSRTAHTDPKPRSARTSPGGRGALIASVAAVALAAVVVAGVIVLSQRKKERPEPTSQPPAVQSGEFVGNRAKPAVAPKLGVPLDPTADLSGWTALVPSAATAEHATLAIGKDGAVLLTGPVPANDVFTLVFPSPPKTFTELRLDVIPYGPPAQGGQPNDFVLTTIKAQLDGPQPRALKFVAATDTVRAADAHAGFAIDDADITGWSTPYNQPNHAAFTFEDAVTPGGALRVTLEFKHDTSHRILCHFRLLAK